jgi:zinc/manganese transport system ATP-binding protein
MEASTRLARRRPYLIVVCHDLTAVRQHITQTLLIKNSGCVFGSSLELIHQQPQTQVA